VILAYNFTEATFKGVHLVWTVFYLIAIDYPPVPRWLSKRVSETIRREDGPAMLAGGYHLEHDSIRQRQS
jgi:hypothetical protein